MRTPLNTLFFLSLVFLFAFWSFVQSICVEGHECGFCLLAKRCSSLLYKRKEKKKTQVIECAISTPSVLFKLA